MSCRIGLKIVMKGIFQNIKSFLNFKFLICKSQRAYHYSRSVRRTRGDADPCYIFTKDRFDLFYDS